MRWNGRPGTVAVARLQGPAVDRGEVVVWAAKPRSTVVAEIPAASGDGTILFCQLDLQGHVRADGPSYDPVAERILLNLLSW